MARYACVHQPDNVIWEVREGDAPPSYRPPNCQWVDISNSTLSDQQLVGSTWDGTQVIPKTPPRDLNPDFDMGSSMRKILTG